jgi:hypothetical protein
MRSKFRVAAVIAITLSANAALAETITRGEARVKQAFFACPYEKDLAKIVSLALAEHDEEAATNYGLQQHCVMLRNGDKVYVSQISSSGIRRLGVGYSCVRTKGDPTCYWTLDTALTQN